MEIKLSNIGVISDSSIKLEGLTVITGKNGSGKTTVGKAVYSLIDAVSNLQGKAEADKKIYTQKKLRELNSSSNFYTAFQAISRQTPHGLQGQMSLSGDMMEPIDFASLYPTLCGLSNYFRTGNLRGVDYDHLPEQLINELKAFQDFLRQFNEYELSDPVLLSFIDRYDRKHRLNKTSSHDVIQSIEKQIETDLISLSSLVSALDQEPDGEYAKRYIDRTLNTEFSDQIQPVGSVVQSRIQITEEDQTIFDIIIQNNHVVDDYEFSSTKSKVFFIDNPSILDNPNNYLRSLYLIWGDDDDDGSYFIPGRIVKHATKMGAQLHNSDGTTVLEQGILDAALRPIKEKIDTIIPGTFDFSSRDEYYIRQDGEKLRLSNLAAESKIFSILKILLERGLLDENTVLILDEPEIHLHPEWQNQFAELIVLLVKELKVKVLMTTHSSNFMLAIDAFMRKYEINEQVDFYQAEQLENGLVTHRCVNDHMELIYQDFLNYFAEVKVLRDRYALGNNENGEQK